MSTNYPSVFEKIELVVEDTPVAEPFWRKAVEHGLAMCKKRQESPYTKDRKPSKMMALHTVNEFVFTLNLALSDGNARHGICLGELYRSTLQRINSSRRAEKIRSAKVRSKIVKAMNSSNRSEKMRMSTENTKRES